MANGDPDKMPQTVDVSTFFYPKTGLTYMVEVPAAAKKYFSANIPEDTSILTVEQMEADSTYMNYMFTVKAMSPNETFDKSTIYVRRNQPPMIVRMSGTPPDDPRGAIPIWVTGSEMDIKAMQVSARATGAAEGADGALSGMYIYTAIGAADNKMDAFFSDDAGNKLTFEPAPLTFSDAEKLSIIGATEKITLMGKKTTAYDTDGDNTNDDDMAITVKISATDDGGLALMDDPADVFMVKVDMAPKTVGRIGHRVLELAGAEVMSDAVADVTKYFKDDRSPLKYIAWSSDPNVVTVMGNADNSKEYMLTGDDDLKLAIVAKGRGSATITLKAMENPVDPAGAPPTAAEMFLTGADKGQAVEQTFMVEVK